MRIILCAILVVLYTYVYGQSQSLYSRVKVDVPAWQVKDFLKGGFDVDHGLYLPGRFYIGDMADWEIERARALGLKVSILINDVSAYYANQKTTRSPLICQEYDYPYAIPENFTYGSMGGFLTYSELIDQLDLMALLYPNLISQRAPVGTQVTHQGRSLDWVRISDNATADENEPEVLYTALHHAREPISMMQMVYFMWYVLENYQSDPEIKYLLDNTELYFIPCVNPDGYIYNEITNPDGGGNWRKNMRDNNDDDQFTEKEDGVDLNRNYAFAWAADDEGSSSVKGSTTYRGPEPFSEPETRAISEFVRERELVLAMNYHAFGNFLLYPWGFSGAQNPDSVAFESLGELFGRHSGHEAGTSVQTLGYLANGVASDWMYAAHDIKAFTPEIGDMDWGFWPPEHEIVGLCNTSMYKNLTLAHLSLRYAVATEVSHPYFIKDTSTIDINVKRYGLQHGTMALSVEPLSPELEISGFLHEVGFSNYEDEHYMFDYILNDDAEQGKWYSFVVKLDNGDFEVRDTVSKLYSTAELAFEETGDTTDQWNISALSRWGVTDEYAFEGENSLTDSPYGLYGENLINEINLLEPVDLRNALRAELRFKARWEIEEIIDYAMVQISLDGVNYFPLCGEYSKSGSIFQLAGEPIYDGVQDEWIEEVIDLTDYVGEELYVQFSLISDGYFQMDGIYLDDIEVVKYFAEKIISSVDLNKYDFEFRQFPNPASAAVTFGISRLPEQLQNSEIRLKIYNSIGQLHHSENVQPGRQDWSMDISDWPSGVYTATLMSDGTIIRTSRLAVTH